MFYSSLWTEIWYLIRNRDEAIFIGSDVKVIWTIIVFIPLNGVLAKNESGYTNVGSVGTTFISPRVSISVPVPQFLRTSLVIKSFLQKQWMQMKKNGQFPSIQLFSGLSINSSYFRTTHSSFLFQDYPLILLISRLPNHPSYFRTTH